MEEELKEFSHKSEAGSLIEEVKLLVVLVGSLAINLSVLVGDNLLIGSRCCFLSWWLDLSFFIVLIGRISFGNFARCLNLLNDLGLLSHMSVLVDGLGPRHDLSR